MRLDRFICKSTEFGRSDAVQLIKSGEVRVNGEVVFDGAIQVHENNKILLGDQLLKARDFRYALIHKPINTVCSNVDEIYPTIFSCVDIENTSELHIVGRLDVDTTGLVLVTDDGRWSFDIIRPATKCQKVYRVGLSREISIETVFEIEKGLKLQGELKLTSPAIVDVIGPCEVLLTITEGRYHQVKRMFAAVGNRVISLHRERIGNVILDVDVGQWRYLSKKEVESFIN